MKGISGDKGGHQECDRGISALCLTREPFPVCVEPTSRRDISCVDARTRRMCKRLAGPAGAVWALDVCPFEGEWEHRVAGAGTTAMSCAGTGVAGPGAVIKRAAASSV